jgi:hypothetical protein
VQAAFLADMREDIEHSLWCSCQACHVAPLSHLQYTQIRFSTPVSLCLHVAGHTHCANTSAWLVNRLR